jgi:phosphoribosylaminoimidazolecarboxamide formyltransferase/IMP cyclohydrolase
LTGFPEMMDGRVKTLHPRVHGGLLGIRGNAEHEKSAGDHGILPIDLLVVNLYPFEATVAKGASYDDCVENIDVGGPAMIRAGAKNHASVSVVVEPEDYARVLSEISENDGATTLAFRKQLAAKAFARSAAYDAAISNWFAGAIESSAPEWRAFGGKLAQALRYGENAHQSAALYVSDRGRGNGAAAARQGTLVQQYQ